MEQRSNSFDKILENINERHLRYFLGPDLKHFTKIWKKANGTKTWDWEVFKGGNIWMIKRKMYFLGYCYSFFWLLLGLLGRLFNRIEVNLLFFFIVIAAHYYVTLQCNYWYILQVDKKIKVILSKYDSEQVLEELARQGGLCGKIYFVIYWVIIGFLLIYINRLSK